MTELGMTSLLLELANLGVTGIKVYYAGSGDSGSIEHVVYTTDKLSSDEEQAYMYIAELPTWGGESYDLQVLSSSIYSELENFLYSKLLSDIEDWYNNEGGEGYVYILVPSGKYQIENTVYITTSESFEHLGNLTDRASE